MVPEAGIEPAWGCPRGILSRIHGFCGMRGNCLKLKVYSFLSKTYFNFPSWLELAWVGSKWVFTVTKWLQRSVVLGCLVRKVL